MTALPETVPTGSLPRARPSPLPDVEPVQTTVFERFLIGLCVVVPLLAVAVWQRLESTHQGPPLRTRGLAV